MANAFRKPDIHAPRFRPKSYSVVSTDLFKRFQAKFPEHKISFTEFKRIVKTYNEELAEAIIECRDGIELPEGLGHIFIGSCPPLSKRKNVDYFKSKQYGVTTYHKNWDSDNRVMKIFFSNYHVKYKLKNKEIWAFAYTREYKRKASKNFAEEWTKYIYVNNNRKVSMVFKESLNRIEANIKKLAKPASEGYNEFDL